MSTTPVVTPAESAPAIETQEVTMQERLNAATESEYKHWERTGEIPAIKPKSETPPKTETTAASTESSAAKTDETKPPEKVETAPATETGKPQKKRSGDARILQLLDERKQEREEWNRRLGELESRLAKPAEVSAKPDSQPAADGKTEIKAADEPQLTDTDPKTGKPFATIAAWQAAHTSWLRTQMASEFEGRFTKAEQEREQRERKRFEDESLAHKLLPGREKYADFEKVAFNPELPIPVGSATDAFIRQSENAADLLYHLGQHPEILNGFYRYVPGKDDNPGRLTGVYEQLIHPNLQMMQLARIEAGLTSTPAQQTPPSKTSAPAKPLPPPPTVLSAKSTANGDPIEEAIKKKSFADYEKAANESERRGRRA